MCRSGALRPVRILVFIRSALRLTSYTRIHREQSVAKGSIIKNNATVLWRCFLFWRAQKDSLARHIRVGCGATVTICRNYRLANLLVVERRASKSRGAKHKLNRHTAVEFLAHPARFERAVPAFGGRCSIQLSHGCLDFPVNYTDFLHKINT